MLNANEIADMIRNDTLNSRLQRIQDGLRKAAEAILQEGKHFASEEADGTDEKVVAELTMIRQILLQKAETIKNVQAKWYPNSNGK